MITVSKSKLKARMLEYFRKAEQTGEDIVVTDNRKPVLRITSYSEGKTVDELFSDIKGKVKFHAPVEESTEDEWGEK